MFNVKVEYESTPIRHIAVQCPVCGKWFNGRDIVKGEQPFDVLRYSHDINWAEFKCPVCGEEFGGLQHNDNANIKEVEYPEVYDGCLEKKKLGHKTTIL
jgi:predicted RNA-binding Zn-ribbon protein involved in translation (DUF1610 family)